MDEMMKPKTKIIINSNEKITLIFSFPSRQQHPENLFDYCKQFCHFFQKQKQKKKFFVPNLFEFQILLE